MIPSLRLRCDYVRRFGWDPWLSAQSSNLYNYAMTWFWSQGILQCLANQFSMSGLNNCRRMKRCSVRVQQSWFGTLFPRLFRRLDTTTACVGIERGYPNDRRRRDILQSPYTQVLQKVSLRVLKIPPKNECPNLCIGVDGTLIIEK
jgi:hypothetical protein